jgi:DNA ligase (NAD+)
MSIDGIGETTAQSIHNYRMFHLGTIESLLQYIKFIEEDKKESIVSDNPFKGARVYATGKFANYKKDEIKKVLESLGAEFASGYAKSLNYLIVGSLEGSSKVDKAKKDKIKIIMEDDFIKMIK